MTVWRDPLLPHQIVLCFRAGRRKTGMEVVVTCNCLPVTRELARRPRWDDPGEPLRIWREHMTRITLGYPA